MRQPLIILLSLLCLWSCTLSESVKTDIIPMPTLRVGYNTANLSDMRIYVFDNDGLLLQQFDQQISASSSDSKSGNETLTLDLLRGVAQTTYTVISYANSGATQFADMTIGSSRIENLQLLFEQSSDKDQVPELLYNRAQLNVLRTEQIKTNTQSLSPLHQQIEFSVIGLELADKPLNTYRAELSELPLAYDALGASYLNQGIYIPTLNLAGDVLTDNFRIFRLSPSGFHIRFWEGDRLLVDVQVKPTEQDISKDVLQIKVIILSAQISLLVGDWEYVINTPPSVGG